MTQTRNTNPTDTIQNRWLVSQPRQNLAPDGSSRPLRMAPEPLSVAYHVVNSTDSARKALFRFVSMAARELARPTPVRLATIRRGSQPCGELPLVAHQNRLRCASARTSANRCARRVEADHAALVRAEGALTRLSRREWYPKPQLDA